MKKLLNEVVSGRSLSSEDAEAAMSQIMAGEATSAQIAGLLVALRLKADLKDRSYTECKSTYDYLAAQGYDGTPGEDGEGGRAALLRRRYVRLQRPR